MEVVRRVLADAPAVGRLVPIVEPLNEASDDVPRAQAVAQRPVATAPIPVAIALAPAFGDFEPPPDPEAARRRRRSRRRQWLVGGGVIALLAAATLVAIKVADKPRGETPGEPGSGGGTTTIVKGKTTGKIDLLGPPPSDSERALAEWVVRTGGSGTVAVETGGQKPFGPSVPLPKVKFAVSAISLPPDTPPRWNASDLAAFRGHEKLASIQLHHPTALTDANLEPLGTLPLRSLELHGNPVAVSGAFLTQFPELSTLTLMSAPNFADADMKELAKLTKLNSLAINSPKLTPEGFKALKLPQLRTLVLGESVALTLEHVAVMQSLVMLEEFESQAGITDEAFLEFAVFQNMKKFRLHKTRLTDAGLKSVIGLGKLEELQITNSTITGAGLDHLDERKGLTLLDLSSSKLDSAAMEKLLVFPVLRELRLANCPINDAGIIYLAEIDSLEILDLSGTTITDATLGALKKHQKLKSLIVSGPKITQAAINDFETATPNCKVVRKK
jgi:hypothetical protein